METISLYAGAARLEYEDAKHLYKLNGLPVPSVTGILGVINKPALVSWAARMAAEHVQSVLRPGVALDEFQLATLIEEAKNAHRKRADSAAGIGKLAHQWVKDHVDGKKPPKPINTEARNSVEAFLTWERDNHVEYVYTERKIASLKHQYAGTIDAVAKVNGRYAVIDYKSSSGIYPEMFLQTAGYQIALEEELPILKFEGNLIVNIRKDGTLETREAPAADFALNSAAFLAALTLHNRLQVMKYN